MNHKALLLWIFLQCAAALFASAFGQNAVLKGKKRLCVYCSYFISLPASEGKCQDLTSGQANARLWRNPLKEREREGGKHHNKQPKAQISTHPRFNNVHFLRY